MAKNRKQDRLQTAPPIPVIPQAPPARSPIGQSPMARQERIVDMLMRDLDEANAQRDQLQAIVNNFSVVARCLFARCEERGSVVLSAEEIEAAGSLDVSMQANEENSLVLTLNTPIAAEESAEEAPE